MRGRILAETGEDFHPAAKIGKFPARVFYWTNPAVRIFTFSRRAPPGGAAFSAAFGFCPTEEAAFAAQSRGRAGRGRGIRVESGAVNLLEKFRETALSVLPVMGLVLALGLLAVPAGAGGPWWLGRFLAGGALLVLGLTVFLLGVDLGIRPMGERCGAALTAKRSLALLLGAAFVVGLVVTAAEPDIQVFGDQVRGVFPAVRKGALTFSIAGGVGLFMALGMLRTTLGIPLKAVLAASYAALFLLAAFAPAPFVGVAFDSGGATTGPMTVPFILALGIGVAAVRARGDRDGGFGLTGVASVGPVAAVLVYAILNANVASSGAPAGGAGERSEPEGVPHAESAEFESHAENAELFDFHAESAENAAPDSGNPFMLLWEPPALSADDIRKLYAGDKVAGFIVQDRTALSRIECSNAVFRPLRDAFAASRFVAPPPDLVPEPVVSAIVPDDASPIPNPPGYLPWGMTVYGHPTGVSETFPGDLFLWEPDDTNAETVVCAPGAARIAEQVLSVAREQRARIESKIGGTVLGRFDLEDATPEQVVAFLEERTAAGDGAAPLRFDVAQVWADTRIAVHSAEGETLAGFLELLEGIWGIRWSIEDDVIRAAPQRFVCGETVVRPDAPKPSSTATPEPIQHSAFGIQHSSFFSSFAEAFPEALRESLSSIAPLFGLFLVFQFALLKMTLRQALRISIGFVWALIGLSVFLTGVNGGFMQAGRILGAALGGAAAAGGFGPWALLVGTGLAFGAVIVCAEPAVWVLSEQVEEASGGAIRRRTLLFFLSLGTALAIGLAMWRAVAGFPLWRLLLPGYALALLLLARTPQPFAGIAFDSGGVASGPLTSTFVLSFTLGAASAGGGGSDSFGVIALVAMMPLAAIQLMGILVDR